LDFLRAELDKTVIELSDSKDRLKKREDELRELKSNLNGHITQVDSEYRLEMDQLKEENENLRRQMASISSMN
jgi:prefoldin subunit 5